MSVNSVYLAYLINSLYIFVKYLLTVKIIKKLYLCFIGVNNEAYSSNISNDVLEMRRGEPEHFFHPGDVCHKCITAHIIIADNIFKMSCI